MQVDKLGVIAINTVTYLGSPLPATPKQEEEEGEGEVVAGFRVGHEDEEGEFGGTGGMQRNSSV